MTPTEMAELRQEIVDRLSGHTDHSRDCHLGGEYLANQIWPLIEEAVRAPSAPIEGEEELAKLIYDAGDEIGALEEPWDGIPEDWKKPARAQARAVLAALRAHPVRAIAVPSEEEIARARERVTETVKRARDRACAMLIAPPSGTLSSKTAASEFTAALNALEDYTALLSPQSASEPTSDNPR